MSLEAMAWAWKHRGIGPDGRLVLMGLADHMNRDGVTTFPGVSTLAAECELSVRSVRRAFVKLEGQHLMFRLPTAYRGEQTTSTVVLNVRGLDREKFFDQVDGVVEKLRRRPERQGVIVYNRLSLKEPIVVPSRKKPKPGEQPGLLA